MGENRLMRGRRVVALFLVVALGLLSRRYPVGSALYDENLGDALYAVAVYLTLGILRPRGSPLVLAGAAFAVCLAIEIFQLTGIPARNAHVPLVRWLLGTHFVFADVVCYLIGVAVVGIVESSART